MKVRACLIDQNASCRHDGVMSCSSLIRCFALSSCTLSAVVLSGCASVATRLPDITIPQLRSEQVKQESAAFSKLERLQARLDRVAFPILKANTDLCPKLSYDIGVKTHSLKNYSKALREGAERELMAGVEPSIIYIRPGSAAEKAGLQPGDKLVTAKGKAVSPYHKTLQTLFKAGERNVQVKRGEDVFTVQVEPIEVCGYPARLSMSNAVNAYANGRSIKMTSGMMNFAENDSELALIVGHELAHNTMGHIKKIVTNLVLSGFATRYTRPFELESDYVGLYYVARAGYKVDDIESIWRRMALINPRSVARAKTHPTYPDRYLRMAAARDEIKAKVEAGVPLIPNFKTSAKTSSPES